MTIERMDQSPRGVGIGLRPEHYSHLVEHPARVPWFEAVTENYFGADGKLGSRPFDNLAYFRKDYPIALHGVSMSLGSVDPLDTQYLKMHKELVDRIDPFIVSDHLCWTGVQGQNLHDLLPLPYTEEALDHVVDRINQVQDYLGRQFLVENVSSYLTYTHSQMTEWEFLDEIADRTECKILLDVNNIYVSARNHGFDPTEFLEGIKPKHVGQFHLAGHSNNGDYLVDTHDHPVCEEVWNLYGQAIARFGDIPTLIEWDDHIPEFPRLEQEAAKAEVIRKEQLGTESRTSSKVAALGIHQPA